MSGFPGLALRGLIAALLYLLYMARESKQRLQTTKIFRGVLLISIVLTLIQVILGTQVRQFVDEQVDLVGYDATNQWLQTPSLSFYIHRTFSVLVLLVNILLWYLNRKHDWGLRKLNWVIAFILLEALTGISMYYFDFPFLSQPLHLVIASLLFGVQFYVVLEVFQKGKKQNLDTARKRN